jgi:hypothetical protein
VLNFLPGEYPFCGDIFFGNSLVAQFLEMASRILLALERALCMHAVNGLEMSRAADASLRLVCSAEGSVSAEA